VLALVVVSCGGAGTAVTPQRIDFADHGATQRSANDGGAMVIVAMDDTSRARLAQLLSGVPQDPGRVPIAVFMGEQRTGGYAIRVETVERSGQLLNIRSIFSTPPPDALTIQVITSPAHLVSVEKNALSGVREVVLIDQTGAERARSPVTQSRSDH
jgi:hypothetical protein